MSHSEGQARFKDGTIKFFEYSGTGDYVYSPLFDTHEELKKNWRRTIREIPKCECEEEPVELYTCYGDGITWEGTACKKCGKVIKGDYLDDVDFRDGAPDWVISVGEEKLTKEFREEIKA